METHRVFYLEAHDGGQDARVRAAVSQTARSGIEPTPSGGAAST